MKLADEQMDNLRRHYAEYVKAIRRAQAVKARIDFLVLELEADGDLEPGYAYDIWGDGSVVPRAERKPPPGV